MKKLFIVLIAVSLLHDVCVSQDFWQETYNFGSNTGPRDFVTDSEGRIYAEFFSSTTLIVSTNDGLTWTVLDSYLPPVSISEHCNYSFFCKNDILFTHINSGSWSGDLDIGHGIFRSYDHGITWENVSEGLGADTNIVEMYLAPNGNILAYYEYYGDGKIYTSTDNGDNWTMTLDMGTYYKNALWVAPSNDIYVSYGSSFLYKSSDNGVTWVLESNSYECMASDDLLTTSTGLLIGQYGTVDDPGFVKSSDNGLTWTTCTCDGLTDQVSSLCITEGDTIFANIGHYGNPYTFLYSTDLAESWDSLDMSGITEIDHQSFTTIITPNGHLLTSIYFDGIYRSGEKVSSTSSGIQDNNNNLSNVSIYPNPASDYITIEGENIQRVEVFDMTGKKVAAEDYSYVSVAKINTLNLLDGVYCLRVSVKNNILIRNLIINKK